MAGHPLLQMRSFYTLEKIFSWKDKNSLLDPISRQPVAYFHSEAFQFFKKYWLKDIYNNILLTVKQDLALMPKFSFYSGNNPNTDLNQFCGYIKKKMALTQKYTFYTPNGDIVFEIKGNFFALDYKIYRFNQEIARISRKMFDFGDNMGIQIRNDIDEYLTMLILGSVIVIHCIREQSN